MFRPMELVFKGVLPAFFWYGFGMVGVVVVNYSLYQQTLEV